MIAPVPPVSNPPMQGVRLTDGTFLWARISHCGCWIDWAITETERNCVVRRGQDYIRAARTEEERLALLEARVRKLLAKYKGVEVGA